MEILENFRVNNQHGLCVKKYLKAGRNLCVPYIFMLEHHCFYAGALSIATNKLMSSDVMIIVYKCLF
jgi:hypothetical protein